MDKILIAEDNLVLQKILRTGLKKYRDKFETLTVKDGQEAIDRLKVESIDLLVTDLQMPNVDGLSLLAYMNEKHPEIPCIVMTAHGTPQLRKKLRQDVLSFIEKPFEIDDLVEAIIPALQRDVAEGTLLGISVVSFLQMIEMEQKTCILEVDSTKGKGFFYFEDGALFDAVYGNLKGLEAAFQLIPIENAKIRLKNMGKNGKKITRRIKQELMSVIMEAMRLKDEAADAATEGEEEFELEPLSGEPANDLSEIDDFDLIETEKAISNAFLESASDDDVLEPESIAATEDVARQKPEKDVVAKPKKDSSAVNLSVCLKELKTINGYRASAIIDDTGEILESDSTDPNMDLNYISALFSDIFQSGDRACKKIGFATNQETTIVTPKATIIMRGSEAGSPAHIHVIAILDPTGNQALTKIELKRMMPAVAAELD